MILLIAEVVVTPGTSTEGQAFFLMMEGAHRKLIERSKDALKEAAKILIHHFMLFSDERITLDIQEKSTSEDLDENTMHIRQLLKTKLTDMDLSVRALNCLKAAEVETLGDLVTFNKNDLLKFRNFGKNIQIFIIAI
jgi:DNA-directed RNA polymerase alpha subunit